MKKKSSFFNSISARILLLLPILFIIVAIIVGEVNSRNIRNLYEASYTERLLLTNALMGSLVDSEDIEYFVNLMKNQSEDFKRRQVEFYHNRAELFRLQEEGASEAEQEEILALLTDFHTETQKLKNDTYWEVLASLKELKRLSRSTYVYVMADTGLKSEDGEALFTYIFDAEDEGEYSSPDMDGLGTSDTGNEAFTNVFLTKKQTEKAEHYEGDFGELYFVCVPILNENNDVVAILGTDLSLEDMNNAIAASTSLFNKVMIAAFIISAFIILLLLSRNIIRPLSSLTKTAISFAEGRLHTSIPAKALKQRTEIGTLAQAFKSTLDATTLYLNSVPESLFIMNRKCKTLFRNEQYIKRFKGLEASEFMANLFPENLETEIEKTLAQENCTLIVWIDSSCFAVILKEIRLQDMTENSILVIANDITDLMNEKENAQMAAKAKSNFLSRMSHEMRTPMNAIIGMAQVANNSDSITSIKHCISTINESSEQLLNIINDVLDMSKIEAGKLELKNAPMNIEKTLIKVCNVVIDSIEKKQQQFDIEFSEDLILHYISDDLRISQVLTNLLSNAVKFTPEGGKITLRIENTQWENRINDNIIGLHILIHDTGIGMSKEQIDKLFDAFEQADGSTSRKFGGTGLGLAISQSIIEKMGGRIDVNSQLGSGSTFTFTIPLEYVPTNKHLNLDNIPQKGIRLLVIDKNNRFDELLSSVTRGYNIVTDTAQNSGDAISLLESSEKYDLVFIDYNISKTNGTEIIEHFANKLDNDKFVFVATYLEWRHLMNFAIENKITHYINKPVFPTSIAELIRESIDKKAKTLDVQEDERMQTPDLSGIKVLLAEDIEINREVFLMLVEGTNISTDIAENGSEAVAKFKANPDLYDLIIMDIQMPEMDGYEATRTIRAMDIKRAKEIPIVAMSADAFKEDIARCIDCGMNDHIAKPIDMKSVFEKISKYANGKEIS